MGEAERLYRRLKELHVLLTTVQDAIKGINKVMNKVPALEAHSEPVNDAVNGTVNDPAVWGRQDGEPTISNERTDEYCVALYLGVQGSLSDDDIWDAIETDYDPADQDLYWDEFSFVDLIRFARAIEAKLKEKI